MDDVTFKQLSDLAAKIQNPGLIDDVEFRVQIDVCIGDQSGRWVKLQGDPDVISKFLLGIAPKMSGFQDAMKALIAKAKADKD